MPGEELLRESVELGDQVKIRDILNKGIDVNTNIGDGFSHAGYRAVHWAAAKGHLIILEILVKEYKTDINAKNLVGHAPLHTAIHRFADQPSKGVQVVAKLLELGANPNEFSDGYQILGFSYSKKQTPLHQIIESWPASKALEDIICMLFQYGANLDEKNDEGETIVDLARVNDKHLYIFNALRDAAQILYKKQRYLQTVQCYSHIISTFSFTSKFCPPGYDSITLAGFYIYRGQARAALNEWQLAEKDFLMAIKHNAIASYFNELGKAQHVQGKYSDAEKSYQQAVQGDPRNVEYIVNLGNVYFVQGDDKLSKAKKYFKKALKVEKDHLEASIKLGKIYFLEEKFSKAIEKLQAAVDMYPDCTEGLFELAQSYYEVNNYERASEYYLNWCNSHSNEEDFRLDISSMLCIADSLFNLQDFKLAEEQFQIILNEDSENYDALIGKANALRGQGQYSDALKIYQQLLQTKTNDSEALAGLGRTHYLQGNYREALNYLRRAYAFDKEDSLICKWLIDAEKIMGNIERVVMLYEKRDANLSGESQDNSSTPGNNSQPLSLHELLDSYCDNKKKFDFEAFEKLFFEALQTGADIAEKDKQGNTLLHRAIILQQPEFIKVMLQQPIDPNLPNAEFKKPLDLAIEIADLLVLKILLSGESLQIETYDKSGYMPLHHAAESGKVEVAQILVDAKADINALTEKERYSALYFALLNKHQEMTDWLLDNGAVPDVKCLRIAFSRNDEKMFKLLLQRGARLLEFSDQLQLQSTVFHLAAEENDLRKFERFFSDILQQTSITIEDLKKILFIKDKERRTALEIAINKTTLTDKELFKWIDVFATLGEKIVFRYLEVAVQKKHLRLLENLFQRTSRTEICGVNADQQNLFHLAVLYGADESILNLINSQIVGDIERGVLLNVGDKEGDSPLFLSIKNKNSIGLRWLLKQTVVKINRDNGTDFGRQSALHIAVNMRNEEAVSLLCQHNDIQFYTLDREGNSPLFFSKNNKVIRKTLKNKAFDQFWITLSSNLEINLNKEYKKYLSLFLERLKRMLENKDDKLVKLQNTIINYPPEKTNKIAKELGAELAKRLNGNLSAREFFKKFNIACQLGQEKQNYQFIDDFLEENIVLIFTQLDLGTKKTVTLHTSEIENTLEKMQRLKRKAFCRSVKEGLRYQFYIGKALIDDKVGRKPDWFDNVSDFARNVSPLVADNFPKNNFNSALILTFLNIFASIIKSYKDKNELQRALYVIEAFGDGDGSIDEDKIKSVADQLYDRFRDLISRQSVGYSSSGFTLRKTHSDGVVKFAMAITERINAHILKNESKNKLDLSSPLVSFFKSTGEVTLDCLEKIFLSPQNRSPLPDSLSLVRRCIFATYYESVGEDIDVKLDETKFGESITIKAGNLLRFTDIRLEDNPKSYWSHPNAQPEWKKWGCIYATENEAKLRRYTPSKIEAEIDDNKSYLTFLR